MTGQVPAATVQPPHAAALLADALSASELAFAILGIVCLVVSVALLVGLAVAEWRESRRR